MKTIYQKVFQNARLHQKISLNSFANKLSVNKAHISRIENGKQNPSITFAKKIRGRSGGIISDEEAFLEQVAIELLELGIKVREDKIAKIKAIV